MAVDSNKRSPRGTIRSFLPNFHFLAEEKYPSKIRPEEEGKLTVSPGATFVSVALSIGAAAFEVTIDPFCFNVSTSEHHRETKVWSLLWSNRGRKFRSKSVYARQPSRVFMTQKL